MIVDFETKSNIDIKTQGLYRYASDPSTDVFCLAYGRKIWRNGIDPNPLELFAHIESGGEMHAYNAAFESAIWREIMVKRYKWPEVPQDRWFCTAARCAVLGLPKKLENVGEFLGLSQVKDSKGHRVMMKLTKPDKKTGKHPTPTTEELEALFAYCLQDCVAEEAIEEFTEPLSKRERGIWLFDQKVNQRGVFIDVELARSASAVWAEHLRNLNAELAEVSKGELNSTNQAVAINRWMGARDHGMPSLSADAIDEKLKSDLPDDVRRVLELRREGSSISVMKYVAMLKAVQPDGRVRGCFAYHSASTGRWGGRIIQPQNLPRGCVEEDLIEPLIEVVKDRDLETISMIYPNVGDALGSLVRPTIMAPKGKKLIVADFSQIEARGVAWVAGEDRMLEAFRNKEDVYKIQASDIYKKPVEQINKDERFFGKVCLGPFTKVLVRRSTNPLRGNWKWIIEITKEDEVFDGVNWVKHDGLIYQGEKYVINAMGISATPDHVFYQNGKPVEWKNYSRGWKSEFVCNVFDLTNCGPNYRYTILDEYGEPHVVSNCVLGSGYGLGAKGFQAQCSNYGVDIDEEFAAKVIKAYREANQYTVALWKLLETSAIGCVKDGRVRKLPGGKVSFHMSGHFLKMRLPSGRDLAYYHPEIREGNYGSQLYFTGVGVNDKARSESTYGGKLVENYVQAICRDILIESLSRLERKGYQCVMHVHDEVVLEVDEDFGSAKEVEQIMSEEISWAIGFPVEAVAFESVRYKK